MSSILKTITSTSNQLFEKTIPFEKPVSGNLLLNEIVSEINKFIVCDDETAISSALWIMSTWVVDSTTIAPIAIINAPEKRCGKSILLDLFERLVKFPVKADNITSSVLFRLIELYQPTVLVDEFDTFLAKDKELIGAFNSGYKSNGQSWRCEGRSNMPTSFSTFCCKAISGIGLPPDTILDRGIPIRLKRKSINDKREYISDKDEKYWSLITSQLARFSDDFNSLDKSYLANIRNQTPSQLNDRQRDCWQILFAIAKYAGDVWFEKAKNAAVSIHRSIEKNSTTTELLSDIRNIILQSESSIFTSADLRSSLIGNEDLAWSSINNGKPITQHQMSNKLSSFGIKSKTVRTNGTLLKGFHISSFDDAFFRYLEPMQRTIKKSDTCDTCDTCDT